MGSGKRNLKARKVANKIRLEEAKAKCASFVGLPKDKYIQLIREAEKQLMEKDGCNEQNN